MKKASTNFLRLTLAVSAVFALTLSGILVFLVYTEWPPSEPLIIYPALVVMIMSLVPFLIALLQAAKLLKYIDSKTAFSILSIEALKKIKYCGVVIGLVYLISLPWLFSLAQMDDAPGLVLLGIIVSGASFVIAVFAAVLELVLKDAIELKSENDLTV